MNACRLKQRPGFTLVELMVSMAICTVVLAGVSLGAMALRQSYEASSRHIAAQNEQMRVLDYLSRDVRGALSLTILNGGTQLSVSVPALDSTALTLKLGAPFFNVASASAASAQTIVYSLQNGQVLRSVDGVQTVLAEALSSLTFSRVNALISVNVEFSPRYSFSASAASQNATRLSSQFLILSAAGS